MLTACHRSAQSYIERGNGLYDKKQFDEAALNYRNALKRDPKSAEAMYRLGLADRKLSRDVEAYQGLAAAATLAPARDDIRIALADQSLELYSRDPNHPKLLYDHVANAADTLLRKDPNSFDGLRLQADRLVIDNRMDDAVAEYEKANSVRPL